MILGLAPMDGITDLAYRIVTKRIFDKYNKNKSNKLWLWTEFMSVDGYQANPYGVVKHIMASEYDRPLIAQFFGGDKNKLCKTAKDLYEKYDFDYLELNMGCPASKVIANGAGSALMKNKNQSLDIIKSLSNVLDSKLTIKTRMGRSQSDIVNQKDFLVKSSKYCEVISIHGRTYKQEHSGKVDWNYIYDIKNKTKGAKVVGNGGIVKFEQIENKLGNLDGVMIGRGAIGNPWIFVEHTPNQIEIFKTIKMHLNYMIAMDIYFSEDRFLNNRLKQPSVNKLDSIIEQFNSKYRSQVLDSHAVIEFRKHMFAYLKGLPDSRSLKQKLARMDNYFEIIQILKKFLIK